MRNAIILFLFSFCSLIRAQDRPVAAGENPVKLENNGTAIIAKIDGKPVLQYNYKTQFPPVGKEAYYQRSGFIHPVYSPSGDTITEAFPKGHTHQHGVFNAWVNTEFKGKKVDFWNQQDEMGTVVFKEILAMEETTGYARFKTRQQHLAFIGQDSVVVLDERWTITIYPSKDPYIWDIEVEQRNIANAPLELKKYHYGGMAFRGRDAWDYSLEEHQEKDKLTFATNTETSRNAINHSNPEWITMTGKVDGKTLSLSVIPSQNNFRAPEFVRVHPEMPYFCFTPFVENGYSLKPGDRLVSKYRVVTSNNILSAKVLNALKIDFDPNQ